MVFLNQKNNQSAVIEDKGIYPGYDLRIYTLDKLGGYNPTAEQGWSIKKCVQHLAEYWKCSIEELFQYLVETKFGVGLENSPYSEEIKKYYTECYS